MKRYLVILMMALGFYLSLRPAYAQEIKDSRLNEIIALQDSKDYSNALNKCNEAIIKYSKDPLVSEFYYQRGRIHLYGSGAYSKAISDLSRAAKMDPGNAHYQYTLGAAYYSQKNWVTAAAVFTKVVEIDPKYLNGEAYYAMGYCQLKLGDYGGSVRNFTEAIKINPNNAKFYIDRASAYFDVSNFKAARDDTLKARSLNSDARQSEIIKKNLIEIAKHIPVEGISTQAESLLEVASATKKPSWTEKVRSRSQDSEQQSTNEELAPQGQGEEQAGAGIPEPETEQPVGQSTTTVSKGRTEFLREWSGEIDKAKEAIDKKDYFSANAHLVTAKQTADGLGQGEDKSFSEALSVVVIRYKRLASLREFLGTGKIDEKAKKEAQDLISESNGIIAELGKDYANDPVLGLYCRDLKERFAIVEQDLSSAKAGNKSGWLGLGNKPKEKKEKPAETIHKEENKGQGGTLWDRMWGASSQKKSEEDKTKEPKGTLWGGIKVSPFGAESAQSFYARYCKVYVPFQKLYAEFSKKYYGYDSSQVGYSSVSDCTEKLVQAENTGYQGCLNRGKTKKECNDAVMELREVAKKFIVRDGCQSMYQGSCMGFKEDTKEKRDCQTDVQRLCGSLPKSF